MDLEKLHKKLKNLQIKLDKALDDENFEAAADLRDKIEKCEDQIKRAGKKNDLEQQFNELEEVEQGFSADMFFPGNELSGLGENVEMFDYEGAFDELRLKSVKVIEVLVLNIFNNDKSVLEDPVIREKMQDDIDSYTDLKFAVQMSRRLFMNGLRDLENGQQNSRMYEVVSKMQQEMRHNNKMLTQLMKDFNIAYRQLKDDMAERLMSSEEEENTNIIDMRTMNETIQKHLEEKKKKRLEERSNMKKSQAQLDDEKDNGEL